MLESWEDALTMRASLARLLIRKRNVSLSALSKGDIGDSQQQNINIEAGLAGIQRANISDY